jgi:hypothetical protein
VPRTQKATSVWYSHAASTQLGATKFSHHGLCQNGQKKAEEQKNGFVRQRRAGKEKLKTANYDKCKDDEDFKQNNQQQRSHKRFSIQRWNK